MTKKNIEDTIKDIWQVASPAILDELSAFGQILLNEVQQRSGQLDAKLTTMLGVTGAMLAFLLIGNEFWSTAVGKSAAIPGLFWYRIVIAFATVFGLACIVCCYLGLKMREWIFPSENDWLNSELFAEPENMKRFHIISMLEVHSAHNKNNEKKALRARIAELLLASAALLIGCVLLARVLQQLL